MQKIFFSLILLIAIAASVSAQGAMEETTIGSQTWTASNLDVFAFRNGDAIPQATSAQAWIEAAKNRTPAWCYYDFDPANREKHGKLYNWYALKDDRGLAPKGWHVPTLDEWKTLIVSLGGKLQYDYYEYNKEVSKQLQSTSGWQNPYNDQWISGNNASGFNAEASGLLSYSNYGSTKAEFINLTHNAFFWTSTKFSSSLGTSIRLDATSYFEKISSGYGDGLSVRLVKD